MEDVQDGNLQLPSEIPNTGQLKDYSQVTRKDGTEVIRERTSISDPAEPDLHAGVSDDDIDSLAAAVNVRAIPDQQVLLYLLLQEQRKTNFMIGALLGITTAEEEEDQSEENDV